MPLSQHPFTRDFDGDCSRCPLPEAHPVHTVPVAAPSAAVMNAVGSPTGRVATAAPHTSVAAATRTDGRSHRATILRGVIDAGVLGLTSIEAAALLPLTAQGHPQVSNRSASRLGELWEEGQVTILRERGVCTLGVCHPHHKPQQVHRPASPCEDHGKPRTRDGASIWVTAAKP